ncbi:hypothetical protein ACQKGL_29715 [Ensifer adhaerens]|uniref:hypothetical protein n=1 Tax=Ensifer adhaerens TaxID=106592 RepID=UPI003D04D7AF
MGDNVGKYWEERKAITAEVDPKIAAGEAAFAQRSQEVERLAQDIQARSAQVNWATMEFIRFFIENKADLSPDLQEYVTAWQKENVGAFDQLARTRDALKDALKAQHEAGNEAAYAYEAARSRLYAHAKNFESMIKVQRPQVTKNGAKLPL